MDKIKVEKVQLQEIDKDTAEPKGNITVFSSINDADKYLYQVWRSQPNLRFEFKVFWLDGTDQLGRTSHWFIASWLKTWAARMIEGPPELTDGKRIEFVNSLRQQNPRLYEHAIFLRDRLEGGS